VIHLEHNFVWNTSGRKERNILQTIKRRKANWIGRNCLLKHVIDGKKKGRIEVTGR
jgi:hypothetical protein